MDRGLEVLRKGLVYDLGEKYGESSIGGLISVVLSSRRARATGMRQSDSEGASIPGLPRMRQSGWDSLMVHDSKLRFYIRGREE